MDRKTDMGHQKSKTQTGVRQTLTTTIKRQFLAEIVEGTKLIEYREIKPYWTKKFRKISVPFNLRLINGMSKTAPEVTVLITTITKGKEWELHIGRVLAYKNWPIEVPPTCQSCGTNKHVRKEFWDSGSNYGYEPPVWACGICRTTVW
jgi:hypothetical protein